MTQTVHYTFTASQQGMTSVDNNGLIFTYKKIVKFDLNIIFLFKNIKYINVKSNFSENISFRAK